MITATLAPINQKILVILDENQVKAINKLKVLLASEDVLLLYPEFKKLFDLTTDASPLCL